MIRIERRMIGHVRRVGQAHCCLNAVTGTWIVLTTESGKSSDRRLIINFKETWLPK